MVTKAKCKYVKTSGKSASPPIGKGVKLATGTFVLLDGGTGTFTTEGVNEAGQQVAIDTVATEVVTSDDPNLVVGPVSGMTVPLTAPATGTGTANVTWTATWNDGSTGPFIFVGQVSYSGGKITGIVITQS